VSGINAEEEAKEAEEEADAEAEAQAAARQMQRRQRQLQQQRDNDNSNANSKTLNGDIPVAIVAESPTLPQRGEKISSADAVATSSVSLFRWIFMKSTFGGLPGLLWTMLLVMIVVSGVLRFVFSMNADRRQSALRSSGASPPAHVTPSSSSWLLPRSEAEASDAETKPGCLRYGTMTKTRQD